MHLILRSIILYVNTLGRKVSIEYCERRKENQILILGSHNDPERIHHEKTLSGIPLGKNNKLSISYNDSCSLNKIYKNIKCTKNISSSPPHQNKKFYLEKNSVAIDLTNLFLKIDSNIIKSLTLEKQEDNSIDNNKSTKETAKEWIAFEYQRQVSAIFTEVLNEKLPKYISANDREKIIELFKNKFNIDMGEYRSEPRFPKQIRRIILLDNNITKFVNNTPKLNDTNFESKNKDPDGIITRIINEIMFDHYFTHTTFKKVKEIAEVVINKYISIFEEFDNASQKNLMSIQEGEVVLPTYETFSLLNHKIRPDLGSSRLNRTKRNKSVISAVNHILNTDYP